MQKALKNAATNGYKMEDYFSLCGSRIYGFHIKDRNKFFKPNCPFGEGEAEIMMVLRRWKELPNISDITLQSFRTPDQFIDNARAALDYVKKYVAR